MHDFVSNVFLAGVLSAALTFTAHACVDATHSGFGEEDKIAKARAEVEAIHSAVRLFRLERERWPATLDELMENDSGKRYLSGYSQNPKDPWGNDYIYAWVDAPNGVYWIISRGADGRIGGSDDDADIVHPSD